MNNEYVLAIDLGTGSCRAVVFDRDGQAVATRGHEWTHPVPEGVPGGEDFDVDPDWRAICACIRAVIADIGGDASRIKAVSATSMREGIVLYDESGTELWACTNGDARASKQVEDLVASGDAERIYAQAGDWVAITSPGRLRWLAENRPEIVARTRSISLLSDWVVYRLSGVIATEPSCGSSSGMFNLSTRSWSPQIAALCGLDKDVFPPVVEPGSRVGVVTERAAEESGLIAGTPVAAGGADTQLGLLATGTRSGELTVVGGTFWQTALLISQPTIDPQRRLRTLCDVHPGQWMIEGVSFWPGLSMRWLRDAICADLDGYEGMEWLAQQVEPSRDGVMAMLSNVMNAKRWVHSTPAFLQFDVTDPVHCGRGAMVRAVEEAAAYVSRAHCDLLREVTGATIDEVVFTGGAAKGTLWPQIVADVLDMPLHIPAVTESSALGAALCAGVAAGWYTSPQEPLPHLRDRQRTYLPDANAATYQDMYGHWRETYARMEQMTEDLGLKPLWRAAGT